MRLVGRVFLISVIILAYFFNKPISAPATTHENWKDFWGCVYFPDDFKTVMVVGENKKGDKWLVLFNTSLLHQPVEVEKERVHFFGCPSAYETTVGERL